MIFGSMLYFCLHLSTFHESFKTALHFRDLLFHSRKTTINALAVFFFELTPMHQRPSSRFSLIGRHFIALVPFIRDISHLFLPEYISFTSPRLDWSFSVSFCSLLETLIPAIYITPSHVLPDTSSPLFLMHCEDIQRNLHCAGGPYPPGL